MENPRYNGKYSLFSIIPGKDIREFVKTWNSCELNKESIVPSSLKEIIAGGDLFVSSGLKRTHEFFQILGINGFKPNDLFNEAELPYGIGESIKLPLIIWLIALRLLWRFGLSINSESYNDFIKRIRKAVDFLEENRNVTHVILMSHGFVNHTMKKELLRRGWKLLSSKGGHRYWSYSTFGKSA